MWARLLALCVALACTQAAAQDLSARNAPPILTLNQDRLYAGSLFAQRVRQDIAERSRALASENRQIEAELIAEEQQLTQDRATMDPVAFRALAEDFDERVTAIRKAQLDKRDRLQDEAEEERTRFFELAFPILIALVDETGALAILDPSAVILSSRSIDVTELALERINAALGEGPARPIEPVAPVARPIDPPTPVEDQP